MNRENIIEEFNKFDKEDTYKNWDATDILDFVEHILNASINNNIDYDAISWAYHKLLAFGLGSGDNMDTSLMMDRLNLMLMMQDE